MDGVELAALYTLQHGLPRNAETLDGLAHRHVAGGRILDEARAEIGGDTDLPRCSGRDLFGGDKPIVDPAMDRRGGDAEELGGLLHSGELALLGTRPFASGDLPVRAQAADTVRGEPQASCSCASLAIEDAGDDGVGVVGDHTL